MTKSLTLNQRRIRLARWQLDERMKVVHPIKYIHPQWYQEEFVESTKKNQNIFGGNRSGKTLFGTYKVIKACLETPGLDCWAATFSALSVPIQQTKYYELLPKDKSIKYAKFTAQRGFANRIIIYDNGSKIRFKTYDQGRESFQGAAKDIIHLDEESRQDIVNECRARLIDRNGILLRTLTPLLGFTHTYEEVVVNAKQNPEIDFWYWNNKDNKFIDQEARANTITQYAKKEAEVRETGHFLELTSGMSYYAFSEENIFDDDDNVFQYMDYRPLEISCDFNVALQSWNIGQEKNGMDYEFDFVEMENFANTELMCNDLKNKYPAHKGGYIFYGDIAGSKRSPETSRTNWAIIRREFPNAEIHYQNIKNIKDRVDATNGRLCNSNNERRLFIHKRCIRLIKDCRQVTWEMLLNKSKAGDLTHASDGLSYKLFWKHPLTEKIIVRQYE